MRAPGDGYIPFFVCVFFPLLFHLSSFYFLLCNVTFRQKFSQDILNKNDLDCWYFYGVMSPFWSDYVRYKGGPSLQLRRTNEFFLFFVVAKHVLWAEWKMALLMNVYDRISNIGTKIEWHVFDYISDCMTGIGQALKWNLICINFVSFRLI